MKQWKRKEGQSAILGLALLGMLVFCSNSAAQRPVGPVTPVNKPMVLKMYLDDAGLTADIVNCPMLTALQELAERTGIIFEVRTQNNSLVSLHLNRVDLEESIRRIASGSNTLFVYSQNASSPQRIALVKILPPKTQLSQPSIAYLGTGVITKSNDNIMTPEEAFKTLLDSKKIEMREKAIEYLVSTKNPKAAEAMMKCVSDPAPEIRIAVIEGLAAMNARNALPAIIQSLKDANAGVRQSATTAIALLGDSSNIKDLQPLVSDKDANVVAAAEMAIRKLSATKK